MLGLRSEGDVRLALRVRVSARASVRAASRVVEVVVDRLAVAHAFAAKALPLRLGLRRRRVVVRHRQPAVVRPRVLETVGLAVSARLERRPVGDAPRLRALCGGQVHRPALDAHDSADAVDAVEARGGVDEEAVDGVADLPRWSFGRHGRERSAC